MDLHVSTLFFDMTSYFASVWQAEEPHLRGHPVGVITTDAPGAALIAASREAKALGVTGLMRVYEAKKICPSIALRVAKHDMFVEYHHRIRDAVDTVIPIHRAHSADEFSCLLTGSQQALPRALEIAADLQNAILDQVSPALTCSVGVAPNKMLAKVAAALRKPGIDWMHPTVLPQKIAHLRLKDLPGVSTGILPRLAAAGIHDVTALHAMSPKAARHLWRNVEGERFLRQLQGEHVVYPETQRHSLGHGQNLTPQNRSHDAARLVARRLLVKAASRLRREGIYARSLHVSIKYEDGSRRSSDGQIAPTQDSFTLLRIFERYWAKLPLNQPVAVSVMLGGLQDTADDPGDLFSTGQAGQPTESEALCASIDRLNALFGQDTIRYGELPPQKVAYTGAKIVFNRIPERSEFNE